MERKNENGQNTIMEILALYLLMNDEGRERVMDAARSLRNSELCRRYNGEKSP